jgi:hypothetical protein
LKNRGSSSSTGQAPWFCVCIIKNDQNFKENILLTHTIVENKNEFITPNKYINIYKLVTTIDKSFLDVIFDCFDNAFLKNIKLETLISIIKEEKNVKLENLNKWEKIIFFISNQNISDINYKKFLQFVLINNENGPSENFITYWDLLVQNDNDKYSSSIDQIINNIINAGELCFEYAKPLLIKILEIYPNRNFESRQSIATYILNRAESFDFRERFNFVCDNVGSKNFDFVPYMTFLNSVYNLNSNDFNELNTIIDFIKSIYDEYINIPGNDMKKIIDFMLSQTEDKRHAIFETIHIQWRECESKTSAHFVKLIDAVIASDILEKEQLAILEKEHQDRLDKLEKKQLERQENELINHLNLDELNYLETEILKKLENGNNITIKEIINNRRKLININQRRFNLLSFIEQQEALDDFRAKRLLILLQNPINDEEVDCLNELNILDKLFFQQIESLNSIDNINLALDEYKQTRLTIHLSIAQTDEESALIMEDEENEAELTHEDVTHIINQIRNQSDKENLIINEEKSNPTMNEDDFIDYLKTALSIFILNNIETNNTEELTRESFLSEFDARGFDQSFVENCLTEWDDLTKFALSRSIIVKLQKKRLSNFLESLITFNIDLTKDDFFDKLSLDADFEMAQQIWDEHAENLCNEIIVWQNLQKLTITEQNENRQNWLESLRAKRLTYHEPIVFKNKK